MGKRYTEGNICEGKWGGSQRKLREPSECGAVLIPVLENGKGRKVGSEESDFSAVLRKFCQASGESLSLSHLSESSIFLKNGLPLSL